MLLVVAQMESLGGVPLNCQDLLGLESFATWEMLCRVGCDLS